MASPTYLIQISGSNQVSFNRFTRYYWIPKRAPSTVGGSDGWSGLTYTTKASKAIGLLCRLKSADAAKIEAVSAETVLYGGKDPSEFKFGKKVTFTAEVAGNDLPLLHAFVGRIEGSTVNGWESLMLYPPSGHMLVCSHHHTTGALMTQTLYMNLQVGFEEMPGLDTSGERTRKVIFSSQSARIVEVNCNNGRRINVEFWRHNGTTDVNSDAPEGTKTAFVLGTGNNSNTGGTPVALQIDSTNPALVDYRQHMIEATVNGAEVANTNGAFTASTFTFGTAPAALSTLMLIYINNGTLVWPNFSGDAQPSNDSDTERQWSDYLTA